jgi:hypothetical protein
LWEFRRIYPLFGYLGGSIWGFIAAMMTIFKLGQQTEIQYVMIIF